MELKRFEMAYWPVEKLIKYEQNTKTHPDTQIEKIARSIENYGFDQPISVDMSGVIIKGHGRLMAARLLRLDVVPVIIRDDLTIIEAAASRIADNRVAESPWDENLLPLELEMLKCRALAFAPDVVVIGWCDNDFSYPFFIPQKSQWSRKNVSFRYGLSRLKMFRRI